MPTIYELPALAKLPTPPKTVGRLDFRTEGLIILSNDGELIFRLTKASYGVERVYQVLASGVLSTQAIRDLNKRGLELGDGVLKVNIRKSHGVPLGKTKGAWYEVRVREGRNRVIRRLFEKLEMRVLRLARIAYGSVDLPRELKSGQIQQLRSEQIKSLKKAVDLI